MFDAREAVMSGADMDLLWLDWATTIPSEEDEGTANARLTRAALRKAMERDFSMKSDLELLHHLFQGESEVFREQFEEVVERMRAFITGGGGKSNVL